MKCGRCGGIMETVSKRVELVTMRCKQCGHETHALAIEAPPPHLENRHAHRVEVWVEWKSKEASTQEVVAIRSLLPDLGGVSLQELVRRAAGSRTWKLGIRWQQQATELQRRAEALGLDVRFAPVPAEPLDSANVVRCAPAGRCRSASVPGPGGPVASDRGGGF